MLLVGLGTSLLVKPGIIGSAELQDVVGALIVLGTLGWNLYKNSQVTKKLTTAMTSPAVRLASMLLLALLIVLPMGMGLSACGANLTGKPLVTSTSTSTALLQGDTTLDLAWNTAMKLWIANGPAASDATKATIRPLIPKGYALVQAADSGQLLAGETSLGAEIAEAQTIITSISAAAGGK
jgi:hypothetical protein